MSTETRGQVNRRTRLAHTQDTEGSTPSPATMSPADIWIESASMHRMRLEVGDRLMAGWILASFAPYLLPNGELYIAAVMIKYG